MDVNHPSLIIEGYDDPPRYRAIAFDFKHIKGQAEPCRSISGIYDMSHYLPAIQQMFTDEEISEATWVNIERREVPVNLIGFYDGYMKAVHDQQQADIQADIAICLKNIEQMTSRVRDLIKLLD